MAPLLNVFKCTKIAVLGDRKGAKSESHEGGGSEEGGRGQEARGRKGLGEAAGGRQEGSAAEVRRGNLLIYKKKHLIEIFRQRRLRVAVFPLIFLFSPLESTGYCSS